ncbi:MAG: SCP2 sterol-binding domain-containing protein [Longimicrobiaceae bacterium]
MTDMDATTTPLSLEWWERFRAAWNEQAETRERLAGAGALLFEVEGDPERRVLADLDEHGWMTVSPAREAAHPDTPTFTASEKGWLRFLGGELGAVQAVIGGTLRYQGPIAFVMRNRTSFDALAEVAARMNETTPTAARP